MSDDEILIRTADGQEKWITWQELNDGLYDEGDALRAPGCDLFGQVEVLDTDGFRELDVASLVADASRPLVSVARIGYLILRRAPWDHQWSEAFTLWKARKGDIDVAIDTFFEAFDCVEDDVATYARDYWEDECPAELVHLVDWEKAAKDLLVDKVVIDLNGGGFAVFDENRGTQHPRPA